MYEAVHVGSGDDTVELVSTAAAYGFEGVVVLADDDISVDAASLAASSGIDVVAGVEIDAGSPSEAGKRVDSLREKRTIVALRGGSDAMNRFAVETPAVDVLTRPMDGGDFNHVLAKAAADNGVRVECSLAPALRESGGRRVQSLQSLRKLREILAYYDAPVVTSADPATRFELRAPRELLALGEVVGLGREETAAGLEEWGRLADRNRRLDSAAFIEPGVVRGRYDEDR